MPSTLSGCWPEAALVSPVAMATTAAALVSATNRMPSGPKASWPMDLNLGFAFLHAGQPVGGGGVKRGSAEGGEKEDQ